MSLLRNGREIAIWDMQAVRNRRQDQRRRRSTLLYREKRKWRGCASNKSAQGGQVPIGWVVASLGEHLPFSCCEVKLAASSWGTECRLLLLGGLLAELGVGVGESRPLQGFLTFILNEVSFVLFTPSKLFQFLLGSEVIILFMYLIVLQWLLHDESGIDLLII